MYFLRCFRLRSPQNRVCQVIVFTFGSQIARGRRRPSWLSAHLREGDHRGCTCRRRPSLLSASANGGHLGCLRLRWFETGFLGCSACQCRPPCAKYQYMYVLILLSDQQQTHTGPHTPGCSSGWLGWPSSGSPGRSSAHTGLQAGCHLGR